MKLFKLDKMKKGWFVGDFLPTSVSSKDCEVAYRPFYKGAKEPNHVHKIGQEITLIASGRVLMNGKEHGPGDIVVLEPGEASDFEALENGTVVVVKLPSVPGDKYEV